MQSDGKMAKNPLATVAISCDDKPGGNGIAWTSKHRKGHLVGSERKSWNSVPLNKDRMSSRRWVVFKWINNRSKRVQWTDKARRQEMVVRQVLLEHGSPRSSTSNR